MFALALRGVAALVAAVSLISAWFASVPDTPLKAGVPFSAVLQELRSIDTLRMRLLKDQHSVDVWMRRPGLVRREETPQRYEIAAGSRLWKVDETANTVTEGDSRWFLDANKQIDILSLLEVGVTDASSLLESQPRKTAHYAGHDCQVYESMVETRNGQLRIVAYANKRTHQLAGIVAWPANAQLAAAGVPLAELQLVAVNPPVEDDKFVVAKSLSEDGRIGKVSASQGIVLLRPLLARRWTPVNRGLLIKPGDWVKTDLRGANAIKLGLTSEFEITLGPGSLLEVLSATQARLHAGSAQVSMAKAKKGVDRASSFELLAPRTGSRKFSAASGKSLVRVDREEQLVEVPQTPVWLAGFEGTSSNESLGSLIVQIDGRNEPLTVGYHKVIVEIRDQIARTTIEESFVNHTGGRLEGTFHFPLPQDASISGFGMWIGNDLVEADVVEKQRAREIFETILREKRDPGLLEWTGGNIFKARVFPIEAHSEKRVKIVYTQVLPLRANRYRYSYGLRSEMLQVKPLRELSLTVTVNSALGLKNITCPTHSARIQKTEHSGQVEFTAQEYTPNRDFEVVCEVNGRQSDVVVVPHRRGEDGYFLMQLTPPGGEGNWQRELLPEGAPLKLVLLCDTSSSMDSEKRKQQREFVATVLSTLGTNDRFQIAAADVGTVWPFAEPVAATPENLAKVQQFLDDRVSLGWTNLTRAFGDVIKKAPADAQVIYVGDGIVTAGQTDPHSFVKELRRLVLGNEEQKTSQKRGFHAVTVGNSYEGAIVKGIAGLAGGSVRSIGGELTPQAVALELLNELAQPGLRDIQIEFRGVKVAAVYPEKLPNVPAGTQQILVGRYLPEGKDQQGEVIVTGKRGSESVRYVAKVQLKDAEEGNSFIPRLWARGHLEQLLQQGQSTAVRDQVIALSEEFHIMTPYTSLLVLESDADRDRFGVKRRYEMRDGEQFFAEGRGNANFELLQQQMKRAGDWRIGLRRQVLRSLMGLGRNPAVFSRNLNVLNSREYRGRISGGGYRLLGESLRPGNAGPMGGASIPMDFDMMEPRSEMIDRLSEKDSPPDEENEVLVAGKPRTSDSGEEFEVAFQVGAHKRVMKSERDMGAADKEDSFGDSDSKKMRSRSNRRFDTELEVEDSKSSGPYAAEQLMERLLLSDGADMVDEASDGPFERKLSLGMRAKQASFRNGGGHEYSGYQPDYTSWLNTLFPSLGAAPAKSVAAPQDPASWSPEALAVSKSLLRKEALLALKGGLEAHRVSQSFDPRWNRRTYRSGDMTLFAPTGWLTKSDNTSSQTLVNYCDGREVGVFSLAFVLGRVRAAVPQDLQTVPVPLLGSMLNPLHVGYHGFQARVEPAGEKQVNLILTNPDKTYEMRLLIDTQRNVPLKHETFQNGKLVSTITFEDFVQIGGVWLARKSVTNDAKGRKIGETTLALQELTTEQFAARLQAELAPRKKVQFLQLTPVELSVARQRAADGSANVDDRITLLVNFAQFQQWDDVLKQVDAIEKLAADKPGIRWLRTFALQTMRRNEEARQRFLGEARQLAAGKTQDELFLTEFVVGYGRSLSGIPEFLELIQLTKPVFERQPADANGMYRWNSLLAEAYEGLGRSEESLALRKLLAEQVPWEYYTQINYANRLQQVGQREAALAWLQKELDRKVERAPGEDDQLRNAYAELLRQHGSWEQLVKFTTDWIARNPESANAYSHHFSALFFNDQVPAAYALADQWLKAGRVPGKLSPVERARLDAALNLALGNVQHMYFQRIDDRWFGPLAETARFFLRHPHHIEIAQRIIGDYRFQQGDSGDRLRADALTFLQTERSRLKPQQISVLLSWTLSGRMELSEPINGRKQLESSELPLIIWEKIAHSLHARWSDTADKNEKNLLSESLRMLYASRFHGTKLLPFLRERLVGAAKEFKPQYLSALFEDLLSRPWTEEIETECFVRLRELSAAEESTERLLTQLPALLRLVDSLITRRQAWDEQQWRDKGGLDKLTRQEIAKKKAEIAKAAKIAFATRLTQEAAKESNATLAAWMRIERTWLDVRLEQNLPQVAEECWKIMGEAAPKPESDEALAKLTPPELRQRSFYRLLKHRAWVTLLYLAARRDATPAAVARVLKYIDAGLALEGAAATPWRAAKFRFLIALDRADELEKDLRNWIRNDGSTAPWRLMLGRLVAERGKVPEAIELFEAANKDQLLSAGDLRQLADWYLVTNRRADYERSRIAAFKLLPEHQLTNMLYKVQRRWYARNVPLTSQLDEETLFTYRALFEKSARPESYLYQLRELYAACRDFRLLQMVPDAVLGRSPQQIYSYLQVVQNNLLYELRNEATADEILNRVKQLRSGERTPTDLRALDLLEALVERKSSEVLNQPGPHIEKCLAAFKRAFDRKWQEGEPLLMARFLQHLGALPQVTLSDELMRELRALQGMTAAGSRDHLVITYIRSYLLFNSYHGTRRDEAVREMESEVAAYSGAHGGKWPQADNDTLGGYVGLLEALRQFAAGEKVLLKYMTDPEQATQRNWFKDRLLSLYNNALGSDGEVSLGQGSTLFKALMTRFLAEVEAAPDENVRYQLVSQVTNTLRTGHSRSLPEVREETRKFAFETLPAILRRQQSQYHNTANASTSVVRDVLGPKLALQFIVERMEQYPQRFEYSGQGAWNTFGYQLADWRRQVAEQKVDWSDLTPRVLALTLNELRLNLRTGQSRGYDMYYWNHGYYWSEKASDFARVAEEVYKEQPDSGRLAMRVAHYLWEGLDLRNRAIEIGLISHKKGIITDADIEWLIVRLQHEGRYGETIALLEPLIRSYPDAIQHRRRLMAAYFHTLQPQQLRTLVQQIEQEFHDRGRWTLSNIAELAQECQNCQLLDKAVVYFNEAITLYKRTNPFHGRDSWLTGMNQMLARTYASLGQTILAVDAASEAVVTWGHYQHDRNDAVRTLEQVLRDAKDLDGYVKHLDQQTAKSGTDSPLLRKVVGRIYLERSAKVQAVSQLELAIALQSNDRETQQLLISAYDAAGRKSDATRQLLRQVDFDRHNLALYVQLADRLKDNEAEAERAATSLIESAPNESENHTAFAELRQKQNRWGEAIPHWERVAELRRLEPTGLLKLAEAQVHEKRWDDARKSLDTLSKTGWPSRFSDVTSQVQRLQQQLPK